MTTSRAEWQAHAGVYHRFMLGLKWAGIHLAALIAFLTVWFATAAGFWPGLLAGALVLGAGVFAMTHGMAHSSEGRPPDGLSP